MIPTRSNSCLVCGSTRHSVEASGTDYQYRTTDQSFDWCRCADCGHYYINPIPTEDALSLIYPDTLKNYADFDVAPGIAFRVKKYLEGRGLRALTTHVPVGARFLDVGCAAGMLLDVVRRSCPQFEVLEGLEISAQAASRAQDKGYKVYISTIEQAELPHDYYDIVYLQQVIEHVHDPVAVLKKLKASLKPGGRVVLETPHLHSWDHKCFSSGYWEGYHIPRHFNLWTTQGMEATLDRAGFGSSTYKKRIKPVHWTVSLQNWAIGTSKPRALIDFFNVKNPLGLAVFGVIDVLQLVFANRASDVQYVAERSR